MIIIEQNINQDKYNEKLTDENCFIKLVNQNANIMVLNEVVRPEFIVERINSLTNGKYNYVFNEKDFYYPDKNGNKKKYNKILIFYDKEQFVFKDKNENLYSIDSHLDFLHITLCDKDNNDINVIGIRIYGMEDFDDAETMFNSVCKVIDYASVYNNVIMAGDFNNGSIMSGGVYNPKYPYIEYNYHKIFDKIIESNSVKILTDGIDTAGYIINNVDYLNKWTYYNKNGPNSMLDHFIVSSNFREEHIEVIKDESIETTNDGGPDHRIVKLTGKFIKTHFS